MRADLELLLVEALRETESGLQTSVHGELDWERLSYQDNTRNLILHLNWRGRHCVAKIARSDSRSGTRLRQEVHWYRRASADHADVLRHCPRYLGYSTLDDFAILLLEYVPNALTLRDRFLTGGVSPSEVIEIVRRIVHSLNHRVGLYGEREVQYLTKGVHERIRARSVHLKRLLAIDQMVPDYWNRPVTVNDLAPVSLFHIVNWLRQVTPRLMHTEVGVIGKTHGDLHLGNILLQANSPSSFYLVDPNGRVGPIPIYDLAKLAQSAYGFYDLICSQNATLKCPHPFALYLDFAQEPCRLYRELKRQFGDLLREMAADREEFAVLSTQVRLMCLVHFVCLLPHHYRDRYRFVSLLARTVELFHEAQATASKAPS